MTRRALKLTNLIPFLNWKFIITCTSSEKAFSASENPTGHLIWRTFPRTELTHTSDVRSRPCAVPSVGAGGSSWGRAASIRHSPLRPSRERAWLLRASRTHCRRHTEFHGRSHWDWKVNDAGEVIAGVTRKSRQHCSILGVIGSVPHLGNGLETPGRNRWRRREVWCLSGPCCSEWQAHWTEKVGRFSCFSRLSCPRVSEKEDSDAK